MIDLTERKAKLTRDLQQAVQQAQIWASQADQLRGALMLCEELAAPAPASDNPPENG